MRSDAICTRYSYFPRSPSRPRTDPNRSVVRVILLRSTEGEREEEEREGEERGGKREREREVGRRRRANGKNARLLSSVVADDAMCARSVTMARTLAGRTSCGPKRGGGEGGGRDGGRARGR